eukprot:scaffold87702_cov19-Tisochrysis_lutea.AAC.1
MRVLDELRYCEEERMRLKGVSCDVFRQEAQACMSCECPEVLRLSSQDVPTAYAYELEAATIVQPSQVVEMVEGVWGTAARSVADSQTAYMRLADLTRCDGGLAIAVLPATCGEGSPV